MDNISMLRVIPPHRAKKILKKNLHKYNKHMKTTNVNRSKEH